MDIAIPDDLPKRPKPGSDAMRAAFESLNSADVLRKHIASVDASQHLQSIQRRQNSVVAQVESFRKTQVSLAEHVRKHYEEITAASKSISKVAEDYLLAQQRAIDSVRMAIPPDMQRWAADLAGGQSFRKAIEIAQAWKEPFEDLRKTLDRFREPVGNSVAKQLLEMYAKAAQENAALNLDDSATRETVDHETARRAVESARTIAAEAEAQPTVVTTLQLILQAIRDTKDSKVRALLLQIAFPLFLFLLTLSLTPVADFYVKKALEGPKREATKQVKQAAAEAVTDIRVLSDYRFVSAKELSVRLNPGALSPQLGQLHFGQAVRVLDKERDFTLVLWSNSDGGSSSLKGWVFSRYLRRFD